AGGAGSAAQRPCAAALGGHAADPERGARVLPGRRRAAISGGGGRRCGHLDRARSGEDRRHGARAGDREPRGALPRHDRGRAVRRRGGGRMITAVGRIYEWEIAKLLAQKRTYLGLVAATLIPIVFVVVLVLQTGGPTDVPLGRYIRDTGLAVPFVVLFFMSIWGLPLITALVAGDIVAAESHNDTLKTILTRSRDRGQVFAGKVLATLTYTFAVVFALG